MSDKEKLSLDESLEHDVSVRQGEKSYIDYNAELNLFSPDGKIQFEEDEKAARQYFLTHVNPNTVYFHNIEEKLEYLVEHGYYEKEVLDQYISPEDENPYCSEFIKDLFKHVYGYKYRFDTFMGALKFYSSYSMKTNDGKRYLERYEDRIVMVALTLAEGDKDKAIKIADEIITGKLQPATPTFLNAGKKQRGEYVSCFPAGTPVMTDNGYKNIEDITIKDKVLSHDGLFHEVEEKIVNSNSERLVRIKHYGNKEDLLLTPNHPVLVWTNRNIDTLIDGDGADINKGFVWIEAQDVTEEDFIVGANVKENKEEKEYSLLEIFDYDKNNLTVVDGIIKKKNIDRKTRKKFEFNQSFNEIRNNVAKDYDLGLLFGWYISEGHVSKRRTKGNVNKPNGVHFTLGTHEINFIEELIGTIEKVFDIKSVVYPSKFDGSTKISINSPIIGNFFNKILGTGFNKKVIPNDFIVSNREFQLGLIHGVFRGDGHTTSGACSLDLVNPNIISTLQLIMTRLGIITRIRTYINSSGNLTGQLTIPGLPGNNEEIIYSIKKNLNNYIGLKGTGNNLRNSEFYKIEDDKIVYQVKNVEITDDIPDTVYNLEVKDTHTYTVNNVIVHNCFLLRTEDSMDSIANTITSSLQLSKRGGGVGILLTNIREQGSTIKNIEGASSGVIPVMKLLEDSFTYANQLGARQGAGAVYISACHPDVLSVLDTKRENADEKVRIKTLSIGLVIPDIAFEMARKNENLYLFSPKDVYDVYGVPMSDISITEKYHEMVEDSRISKKKISARHLFQTIAELQFESGYPYLLFEDTANQWNNIDGRINMSNLCVSGDTEVLTDTGYKKAKDLYESQEDFNVIVDERARTMDLSNIGTSVQKSTKMFKTKENAAVFKLTTLEGREITATPWHKMYAKRNEEIIKLPLSELEVGDSILINSDDIDQRGSIHNPDLAYISGILVADGTVDSNNKGSNSAKLYLYGEKEECLEKITKSIKNSLKGREDLVERQSTLDPEFIWDENNNRHSLSSSPLYKLLKEQDYDIKEKKVQVPDFVKNADRETQVEFLNGVFQMDGCVTGSKQYNSISIELGSIHHEFLKDIQKLLGTFGISARVYVSKKEDSYALLPDGLGGEKEYCQKKSWVLKTSSLQESSKLYNLLQWRKPHSDRWKFLTKDREKLVYNIKRNKFAIVKDIEFVGYEDVYDVTVENGHSLIFDGIVTGNCSEILQINTPAEFDERGNVKEDAEGRDISCNLASLNIANVMKKGDFKNTVHTAIDALTVVSDNTNISIVPNVRNGNEKSHSIGLGTMNLHGFLGSEKIHYGSDEALDFTNVFYATLRYHSLKASVEIAKEKGTFYDFVKSDYVNINDQGYSKALENYTNGTWETFPHTQRIKEMYSEYGQWYPQQEDWQKLDKEIQEYGLYHAYLNANAPTGNISYVNNSTSSLHPIVAKIEARKQSGLGRVYYPAYGLTNNNLEYYDDAYEIGYKAIIDTYAVAGKHIDQGQSLTLFFKNTDTTRTMNKAYNYAWSRGKEKNEFGEVALYDPRTSWKTGVVKTLYYSRIRSDSLEGTELEGCVSCTI